jgi:hypothetical protein
VVRIDVPYGEETRKRHVGTLTRDQGRGDRIFPRAEAGAGLSRR